MGEKWTLPRSLSNLAEGSKSGETNANPKQVKPQDRPIGEFWLQGVPIENCQTEIGLALKWCMTDRML